MVRWFVLCLLLCAGAVVLITVAAGKNPYDEGKKMVSGSGDEPGTDREASKPDEGPPEEPVVHEAFQPGAALQPLVLNDGRLQPVDTQEVPARRDGQILFIGKEIPASEVPDNPEQRRKLGIISCTMGYLAIQVQPGTVSPELCFTLKDYPGKIFRRWHESLGLPTGKDFVVVYGEERYYKALQVGDHVQAGDLLALVDPTLALAELSSKTSKFRSAEAERIASEKTKLEAEQRLAAYRISEQRTPGSISKEELRGAELNVERYTQEEISKKSAVEQAIQETSGAHTTVRFHEIRATISGVVRVIYKNRGDAIKNLDPVLQIQNPSNLRVEARLDVQEAVRLKRGDRAIVDPSRPDYPRLELRGHLGEIRSVACGLRQAYHWPNTLAWEPVVLSASDDKTVRVWDPRLARLLWSSESRSAARCVAATGPTAAAKGRSLMVCGYADGSAWLYDLNDLKAKPVALAEGGKGNDATRLAHRGPVTCAAFSPDGSLCVTGGDDQSIAVWDTTTGKLVANRVRDAHRNGVTSLQFVPGRTEPLWLMSAGGDQAAYIWGVESGKAPVRLPGKDFAPRSGDVHQLSTDGQHILFDKGKDLYMLGLEDRRIYGSLRNTTGISGFTTFALFAPNGKTILTNGAADGRLQLWRTPEPGGRGTEVRQYIWTHGTVTCAAFAPDSKFLVTGTQDNNVLIWEMPTETELTTKLYGRVTLIEHSLEAGAQQVRVWTELDETPPWLTPGGSAKVVILPNLQH
jgi:hypothetical protein